MSSDNSVSQWIASLKQDDAEAAQKLWTRYSDKLIAIAGRRLGNSFKAVADEEDIAQSVFRSVCRGAATGRFDDVTNRDDLWWLLLAITKRKIIDHIRRETSQKRGGGRVSSEASIGSDLGERTFSLDWLVGDDPTPDFVVMLDEQNKRLLGMLRDDRLRKVAVSRIEGYTVTEIAANLAISTRSVERKLQLIRKAWAKDLKGVQ